MKNLAISGVALLAAIVLVATTTHVSNGAPPVRGILAAPVGRSVTPDLPAAPAFARAMLPAGALLPVPVLGIDRHTISDSWGDARDNGQRQHHGTDIMAPGGSVVIAAAPGRVEKLAQSGAGGTTIYIRSTDGQWSFYYAHLMAYAPGLYEGQLVNAGDPIGYVGDTGNAGAGNYHLHFGLSYMQPGDRWWQGQPVDPYPLLADKAVGR